MSLRPGTRLRASICAVALAAAAGCQKGKSSPADETYPVDTAPFADAAPASVYVPRVKMLLTGLPATDAEVQAVAADHAALRGLIDGWMTLPQFRLRMLDFFRVAFQQKTIPLRPLRDALGLPSISVRDGWLLETNLSDSFALTAWELVQEGRPFTETITTRRYRMTTAMLALLSYADTFLVTDEGGRVDLLSQPDLGITDQQLVLDPLAVDTVTGAPLTEAQSRAQFGPGKTGDWIWRIPFTGLTAACEAEIRAQRATAGSEGYQLFRPQSWGQTETLFSLVFGNRGFERLIANSACAERRAAGENVLGGLLRTDDTVKDWEDWRWVTIEQLPVTEKLALPSPLFWDVPALRAATVLQLKSQRMGFFGTPAWNGNWPTNASNQARVTANQALIVAIGQSIIPAMAIAPAPVTASDRSHSTDPACAACHVVLDPLRQFFRQSYTYSYHGQLDLSQYLQPATFLVGGMNQGGHGVEGLADILVGHPRFALAWAQKLQYWANSNAASESDPELQRIAAVFRASGHDFRVLVREVFSSPLVTLSRGTLTYRQQDPVIGIARRDQLCAALSARLGEVDVCHQHARDSQYDEVSRAGQMLATDTYYRAAELPSQPRNADMFFRASVEEMCRQLANRFVGSGAPSRFRADGAAAVTASIEDLVSTVMGLPPGDDRHAGALGILTDHFAQATTATAGGGDGAGPTQGLRSTFTLACMSPAVVLVGQ